MYVLGPLVAAALVLAGISAPVTAQQWTADDLYADRPFGTLRSGGQGLAKLTFKRFLTTSLTNSVRRSVHAAP
jgi:hypothetical protein